MLAVFIRLKVKLCPSWDSVLEGSALNGVGGGELSHTLHVKHSICLRPLHYAQVQSTTNAGME